MFSHTGQKRRKVVGTKIAEEYLQPKGCNQGNSGQQGVIIGLSIVILA